MAGQDSNDERVSRVLAALASHGCHPQIITSDHSTHTAEQAAAAAGCALGQIVKTLVVYVSAAPMLVLVSGDRRLDDRLLAARFGVGRKQVKMATSEQVLDLTGYEVGGVSPFGSTTALPALVDESFQRFEEIWLAGGTATVIFPLALDVALKLTGGEFAAVAT